MKIVDPIHGPISFEGELEPLRPLLATAPLRRLLHLQQNPFAGFVYAGATHTRFSHAIGTAHVAHKLLRKTDTTSDSLRIACLIAALLQDVGELPFEPALKRLFYLRKNPKRTSFIVRPLISRQMSQPC